MSDSELSKNIVTALTGVAHEFRHFVQAAYTHDGVPESKIVSTRKEADNISEVHHESKVSLDQSQIEALTETLGGSEKAAAIKEDMLYGYGKMGLISVAEQFQNETSAYADGNKAARKNILPENNITKKLPIKIDNRAPIIQAYYYNLAHEIDARNNAPKVVFNLAKDSGFFSKEFKSLAKESVNQTINAEIDYRRQPKKAIDTLINTACGNKKGDKGITPEMIERYSKMNPVDLKIPESDQKEYVEGSIMTLLHHMPQEKSEKFVESLKATSIDTALIDKAIKKNLNRESSIVPVTKEEIIEARPNHFENQTKHQNSRQNSVEKTIEKSLEELEGRNLD